VWRPTTAEKGTGARGIPRPTGVKLHPVTSPPEVIVTAERCRNSLLRPFIEELHDDELQEEYFQQDNAIAHTTGETLGLSYEFFDDRVVKQ
jgi:hypothetical protein